jgi:hypothetical protein
MLVSSRVSEHQHCIHLEQKKTDLKTPSVVVWT